jgi:hypothetical protein
MSKIIQTPIREDRTFKHTLWERFPFRICELETLPAFPNEAAIFSFTESFGWGFKKKWLCSFCGGWHYLNNYRKK